MDMSGELQLDLAHNVSTQSLRCGREAHAQRMQVFKKRLKDGVPIGVVREELSQRAPAAAGAGKSAHDDHDDKSQPPASPPPAAGGQGPSPAPDAVAAVSQDIKPGCGSCYGAQTQPGQCCNTCEEVREAYRLRGWAFSNPEGIAQCNSEGFIANLEAVKGEGCQVYGYLLVNKVAGNFHFSPGKSFQAGGAHIHDYALFKQAYFNLSHTVHSLSFGQQFPGIVNPLDGVTKLQANAISRLYQLRLV
jgi:hypothetical protein